MHVLKIADTSLEKIINTTCQVLSEGGLVIFPTETTYGAGVDATNQEAVDLLLAYKSRREGKPLSIAVPDSKSSERYVELNDQARALHEQFLPGPVTVISRSKENLATGVSSEFGTLGIRIPDYPLMLDILRAFGKPVTATSANASGKKRPYSIDDIISRLSDAQKSLISLVLDAGELPHNEPSTVIDTTLSTPITLRQGSALPTTSNAITVTTFTEQETKQLAGTTILKHWNEVKDTGLLIALDGPLGAGKTIFTKGIAEFLQIADTITSPTYNYREEYTFQRHQTAGMLFHLDVWKIDSAEQFALLQPEELAKPNTIIVIEWFSQIHDFLVSHPRLNALPRITITISEDPQKRSRIFTIQESNVSSS
ncbi:MAG: L-threonylcarbamoyladenylate synthase [Microgenomates group bacterium]